MSTLDKELMKDHLITHDGLITKLLTFINDSSTKDFKRLVQKHVDMLTMHETVMEQLMDDESPSSFSSIHSFKPTTPIDPKEKYKVQDGIFTTKSMALNNFYTAMVMKDPLNKEIHLSMSEQNYKMFHLYQSLLNLK